MSRKFKALIVDDEPIAIKGLENYLKEVGFFELVATCENAIDTFIILEKTHVDVIFMDINMPKISGVEFLKTLTVKPLIVFTTAYPQYAIEGYELDVLDYLLKPISFERFLKSCNKAHDVLKRLDKVQSKTDPETPNFIFVKVQEKMEKIRYHEILYIKSLHNYVAIYTEHNRYITYLTLKSIELKLPGTMFLKVHKSYIISLERVDSIAGDFISIAGKKIPMSQAYKAAITKRIIGDNFLKR